MRLILLPALWLVATDVTFSKANAAAPKSVAEITAGAKPSIVTVKQIGRGGGQEALGTGFVATKDGLIATNNHVIGTARRLQVQLSDGTTHDVIEIHATDAALDLAIIRIGKKDLKPLALGDSEKLAQGQQVVAIGHPQGLEFSVVEGVVSAVKRKIEGKEMIQLAIPIEQGNSGGPLLDLQGRVQGILTLKSALTDNLGFAHPVNQIKLLIEKPNPIPMLRWLTIGRLDPKRWESLMGARWTQHAGVIHVEDMGEGFGGRSLCLNQESPGLPFEAAVAVKLDDEGGAAGLAFCADGRDLHYGFYPSGGKLRLTRFNGPDVFSWTILSDTPSPAYKAGTWNTLRVRVTESKIQCYVNDTLVTESQDAELRGGRIGLCKFRNTEAQFKAFRVGEDLGQKEISASLTAQIEGELKTFLEKPALRDATLEKLVAEPAAASRLLEQRAKTLEEQAAALRKLERDLHRQATAREIIRLLQRPADQAELLRAALLVAKHDNPELDVESCLDTVHHMVEELKNDPAIKSGSASQAAARLNTYLFQECGFHGTRMETMDDFANSYLNEVLDDREGIPLTLSIVYLEIARRLGLKDIYGAGLPGRFMVAFGEEAKGQVTRRFVDVFEGGKILSEDEASRFIQEMTGREINPDHFEPATPRAMVLRLLHNLINFSKKPEQVLPYLDLIVSLDPDAAQERWQRAHLRTRFGDFEGAKLDLETLLEQEPAGLDREKVQQWIRELEAAQ